MGFSSKRRSGRRRDVALWQDLQYAVRLIRGNPGLAGAAVLTLALGIGANTAIFSVVNAVLLSPLPYPEPDRLVQVWMRFTGIGLPLDRNWVSAPELRDVTGLNRSFSHVAAYNGASFNMSGSGLPERIEGVRVSPALFPMLGVRPLLGRVFTEQEGEPGRDDVALISHGLWQRRFGRNPSIVGRSVRLNGRSFEIVGVLPAAFGFPDDVDIWAPLALGPEDMAPDNRGSHGLLVLARIRSDVTLDQARADMAAVSQRMIEQNPQYPYRDFNFAVLLNSLLEETVGDVKTTLWILMGAVAFVLLIACTNIANLLLVHASAREGEIAIRGALGADRRRLMGQMLAESIVLAGLGGLAGLLLGRWGTQVLAGMAAETLPRVADVGIDARVLAFTAAITLATGIFFGMAPALQTVKFERLRSGARWGTADVAVHRVRQALVIGEVALSLILLAGAGLLLRSFVKLLDVDPGFKPERVLTMNVELQGPQYRSPDDADADETGRLNRMRGFFRDVQTRVRALPGVEAASTVSAVPLSGGGSSGTVTVDTRAVSPDQASPEADWRAVLPGYFEAMRIQRVRGRDFEARDTESSAPVAIIDETMAATYWPGENPIGKRLKRGGSSSENPWMTIVAVVRHVRYRTLEAPSRVQFYWPQMQEPWPFASLVIRTSGNPRALISAVQQQVRAVDPEQAVSGIRTMEELMADGVARRRLALSLIGLLAIVALLLAAVGIYGVMAYSVSQRTHEFGIRVALGASRAGILGLVLGRGMLLVAIGCAIGLAATIPLRRAVMSLLYDIDPTDPITLVGVLLILLAVAFVACYLPARRATRVDPAIALRYE
ncbi:MAG: FtsX-like permease family protein [Luteitalea sp.]|nr:FtsX-like permease family protein [Luteitalea sp.]